MKTTVTVPIVRAGKLVELAVTREDESESVVVYVPPASRQANATFELTIKELSALAAAFQPEETLADLVPRALRRRELEGQTALVDDRDENCTCGVLDNNRVLAISPDCPVHGYAREGK